MSATRSINLNTILLSIVLALSAWTLKTLYEVSLTVATATARIDQHERAIGGFDIRLVRAEGSITDLRVGRRE